jgi:hypothetical protein
VCRRIFWPSSKACCWHKSDVAFRFFEVEVVGGNPLPERSLEPAAQPTQSLRESACRPAERPLLSVVFCWTFWAGLEGDFGSMFWTVDEADWAR